MLTGIIDSHTHAFPDHIASGAIKALAADTKWMPVQAHHDGTLAGLLGGMDRAGIQCAILCSVATRPTQVRKITDWSAAVASDRIIPFASIHPDYEQPEAEVERIAQLGLRGLKFHPQYMNCAVDDPRTVRIAKAAARAGLAMAFHGGYDVSFDRDDVGSPRRMRALHEAVPDLRLLACHLGGWRQWDEVLEHLAGQAIYFDTSFALGDCPEDLLQRILEVHSSEFLLFGSDAPWLDQADELAKFHRLPIPEKAKKRALKENSRRFCGMMT